MIIAGTGHRPDKLGGYTDWGMRSILKVAGDYLDDIHPSKVISGMAQGWDTALAIAAIHRQIPLVAAIPFEGQHLMWPADFQATYDWIRNSAAEVCIVCPGGYDPAKMQVRNMWMVDRCDRVVAMWDGSQGGTRNCIDYARRCRKPIDNLYSRWVQP